MIVAGQLELAVELFLRAGGSGSSRLAISVAFLSLSVWSWSTLVRSVCRSDSCLLCSASRSVLLSEAALAWTSICCLATLLDDSRLCLRPT